jgi:hypothetical protein
LSYELVSHLEPQLLKLLHRNPLLETEELQDAMKCIHVSAQQAQLLKNSIICVCQVRLTALGLAAVAVEEFHAPNENPAQKICN